MNKRVLFSYISMFIVTFTFFCVMIITIGENTNNIKEERVLSGDYLAIYVDGVRYTGSLDNLYLDSFVINFDDDVALLSYRG